MASLIREASPARVADRPSRAGRTAVLDSIVVTLGGQLERVLGTLTALALRWGLDPASLGVYTGLRLFLDNTNRSSLGIGLGAVGVSEARSYSPASCPSGIFAMR